jgi:phage-related protein
VVVEPDTEGFDEKLDADLKDKRAEAKVKATPDTTGFNEKLKAALDAGKTTATVKIDADMAAVERANLAAQKSALAAATANDRLEQSQRKAQAAAEQLAESQRSAAEAQSAAEEAAARLERGEINGAEAAKAAANATKAQAQADKDAATAADLATRAQRDSERASIAAAQAKLAEAAAADKLAAANERAAGASGEARAGLDDSDLREKAERDKAELDELGRKDEHARVRLDDGDFKEKAASDKAAADGLGSSLSGLGSSITGLVPHFSMMSMAIGTAIVGFPALGGAMAGLGGGLADLKLSFGGIKQALTDYGQEQQTAAQTAAQLAATAYSNAVAIRNAEQAIVDAKRQAAEQEISSAEAISNAEQSLADARRNAANQAISSAEAIQSAEQSLANAEYSEQQAQQALTQARIDATRQLQQLNDAQKDTALGVTQAQLALQQALLQQKQTDQNAQTTALQRAQADLAVAQAQQALKEAQEKATNAAQDAAKANQKGVEGSKTVQDALHNQQQAAQGVQNAQQALADAQRNAANQQIASAEAIQKAQQGLADAQRHAAQQQIASQEAVQKAVQSLADTQKEQQLQAATQTNQAAQAFEKDMAGMSASGRQLVNQLISMGGQFTALKLSVQSAIFPGAIEFFKGLGTELPTISTGLTGIGRALSGQFSAIGQFLGSGKARSEIQGILTQGATFISTIGPGLGSMLSSLLELFSKAGPASSGLASGLGAIGKGFGDLFKALEPAVGAVGSVLSTLGQGIGLLGAPLGQIIGLLAQGLAPALKAMLPGVSALAAGFVDLFKGLQPAWTALGSILSTLGQAIGSLGGPLGKVIATLVQGLAPILADLLPGFKALAGALGDLLVGALKAIAPILDVVAKAVSGIVVALSPAISAIGKALGQLAPALQPLVGAISGLVSALLPAFKPLLDVLPTIAGAIVQVVKSLAGPLAAVVQQVTPFLAQLVKILAEGLAQALLKSVPFLTKLGEMFGKVMESLEPLLPPLMQIIEMIGGALVQVLVQLAPMLEQVGVQLFGNLLTVFKALAPALVQLLQALIPLIPPILKLVELFVELNVKLLPVLIPLLGLVATVIADLTAAIVYAVAWVLKFTETIVGWIVATKGGFTEIEKLSKLFWSGIETGWKASTDWLYNTLWKGWLGGLVNGVKSFVDDIYNRWKIFWTGVQTLWKLSTDWLYNTLWKGWTTSLTSSATGLWNTLMGGVRTFWTNIQGAFQAGVQGLAQTWNTIENVFKSPVNFLIGTVYHNGIERLWNDIVDAIGLGSKLHLPDVSTIAGGGVLPGYAPGKDTVPALLSPGEAVLVPEAVRAIGPDAINALNAAYGQGRKSKIGRYAGGGIVGGIGDFFGGIVNGLEDAIKAAGWITSFMTDPFGAVTGILDKVIKTTATGELGQIMTGIPKKLIEDLANFAKTAGGGAGAMAMINLAKSQVGTQENPMGSNNQKYSADLGRPAEPWCFAAGTLVDTPDGLRPIETITPGSLVCTPSGKVAPTSALLSRRKELLRLTALGVPDTLVTEDHPYWAMSHEGTASAPQWVPAGELRRGDMIALPIPVEGGVAFDVETAYRLGKNTADSGEQIPGELFDWQRPSREAFLDGFLGGQGASVLAGWSAETASRTAAHGLAKLARSLGWAPDVHPIHAGYQQQYRVVCGMQGTRRGCVSADGYLWVPVRRVEETGRTETVYDLTVPGEHAFIADGAAVHNCADFVDWVATKSGNGSLVPMTASAPGMAQAFGSAFKSGTSGGILPGDIVFYSGAEDGWGGIGHVGIAITGGNSWQSVEGNYGNEVSLVDRSGAQGHARPAYPISSGGAGGSLIHPSPDAAKAYAQQSLMGFGWGNAAQYNALVDLWSQESSWLWSATNPSSGAYGIPQALPADKMASAGSDWHDNAATQIRWGLGYIRDRYGSPVAAEQHEQQFSWYDQGGVLPPGMSTVVNATGKPEAILNPPQLETLQRFTLALESIAANGAGQRPVEVNINGFNQLGPEQIAAVAHALSTAVSGR